jgi:hypothetical protein
MLGLTFVRTTDKTRPESALGFDVIRVVDRTLWRTHHIRVEDWEPRWKGDVGQKGREPRWKGDKGPDTIDMYDYMLHCVCRSEAHPEDEYCSLLEHELSEEIASGIYTLAKGCFEVIPPDLKG